jgi:signal transduction histidine kinase/streptogramin lyase
VAKLPELLGAHFIETSTEDPEGNLWIGTRSQGLFRIGGGALLRVPTSNDEISALVHDRDGNLWVGTNGGGLDRLRPRAHWLFDQGSGLKDNFSYTIAEDAAGAIWLANRDGGVARIRNREVDPISRRAGWRPFSAMSVFPAKDGGMWITTGIGIFNTDRSDEARVSRVPALANTKLVRVSFVARNGDYWISLDPDRVGRWRDGKLQAFGAGEGFEGREVRAIVEAADGAMWFACGDGRLYRKSGDAAFVRVALPEWLQPGGLQALSFEADGTLLVGTTRSGLLIFPQGDFAKMRVLKNTHGLPSNNITNVLADDHGRYWFASRGGIFWVARTQVGAFASGRTERVHAMLLGQDDGVPDLSCQGLFQPSAWKARDGTLWFATRRGVVNTDPALIAGESELPPVTLAEVRVDGRPEKRDGRLVLSSTVRKTEFRFSVLNLTAPDRTVVRYQLDGFDSGWTSERNAHVAVYPRLPPGRYVLRAMASAGGGVWNEQPALLTVVVVAPWWRSGWAQALYVVALVVVVVGSVRLWAHRRLRQRLERLEREQAVERERTRIARDIHDDLGASLTRISLLSQTTSKEGAEQAKVLEQIYETTHTITRSMDEIVWAVNPKFDDLEGLVYYIVNYAQMFLSAAGVRLRLDVPAALPVVSLTSQARHHVFLCCKESLNNVAKHSRAEAVTLAVRVETRLLRLSITDHGEGIGRGSSLEGVARVSAGNGLKNMRRRMEEIGGQLELSQPAEGGMCVSFTVPLAAEGKGAASSGNS